MSVFVMSPLLIILIVAFLAFFIRLAIKKPKLAAIFALIPIMCVLLIILYARSVRRHEISAVVYPNTTLSQPPQSITQDDREFQVKVFQDVMQPYMTGRQSSSIIQSPIWSEGIEDQFQAGIYPSGIAALRALAPRVVKQIPYVMGELGTPETIVIYRDFLDIDTVEQFREALSKLITNSKCRIEIGNVGINMKEVGIHFNLMFPKNVPVQYEHQQIPYPYPSGMSLGGEGASGTIQARIYKGDRILDLRVNYINKSWIDDFSSFINRHPDKQYMIAKSSESHVAPEEADRQVMGNACNQIRPLIPNLQNPAKLNYKDILDSGMVADKFVQSFDGSAGKIWRQAVLLDVSSQKLNHLAGIISGTAQIRSAGLIKTALSIIGLFVLITIVYIFLNAATRGYYTWSLRIIAVFLVVIFLLIILNIFHISGGRFGMGGL